MVTDILLPTQLSAYMIGTTIMRVIIMVFGIFLIARITPIKKASKISGVLIVSAVIVGWTLLIANLGRNNFFRIDINTSFPPPIAAGVIIPIIIGYVTFRYLVT